MKKYSVELGEEMGKELSELSDKLGLTLTALVKLVLSDLWKQYKHHGVEAISIKFQ